MSDHELEKIKLKKAKMLMRMQSEPKEIIEINNYSEFEEITQKYPKKVIIADFGADWCGPCKIYAPIFERLHEEYKQHFIFAKVDVDKNQQLALQYKITGVPTTIFVKGGKLINKIVGLVNYNNLKTILEKLKNNNS